MTTSASRNENRFSDEDRETVAERMVETARMWQRHALASGSSTYLSHTDGANIEAVVRAGIGGIGLGIDDCRDSELRWARLQAVLVLGPHTVKGGDASR